MKQCPICGAQLNDNAPYCHHCGNHLGGNATNYSPVPGESTVMLPQQQGGATPPQYAPPAQGYNNMPQSMPQQYAPAPEPEKKKSNFGLIIALSSIAAFLLGLVIVLAVLYFNNDDSNDSDYEATSTEASTVVATHDAPATSAPAAPAASPANLDQSYIESEANRLGLLYNTVSTSDLAGKSSRELRLLRNYIFAKHYYSFRSADLMAFFQGYSWYQPLYSNVSADLSTVEQRNVQTIKRLE